MGISFSCSRDDYDVFDENFEGLILRSISFKSDDVETTLRSVSFNGRDSEPTIVNAFGSGKMIIEGSVSFKGREKDPFHLETMISIKTPRFSGDCANFTNFKEATEVESPLSKANPSIERIPFTPNLNPSSPKYKAAVKLQKVYKSFRTRRRLADCAVLAEQKWWKLLDFAVLKRSSVSFFDIGRPESAVSRWSRARTRAAKVGKGLSKDEKARKLALQHWLEAIDPRHRYGHNLHFYYDSWLRCESRQPFFYWLDVGEGREWNHEKCPRSKLLQQCIKYLGPKEREEYEVIVAEGKLVYKQSRHVVDTMEGPRDTKWIFVLSTSKSLYVGQKTKGTFQHSSFLAGGATSAAGRLEVEKGVLKSVWPHSGHYRPTEENFQEFISFLREKKVDLTDVKDSPPDEEESSWSEQGSSHMGLRRDSMETGLSQVVSDLTANKSKPELRTATKASPTRRKKTVTISIPKRTDLIEKLRNEAQSSSIDYSVFVDSQTGPTETAEPSSPPEVFMSPKWNLFEEDKEEKETVPTESILRRINSKKGMKSYQLGKQLSCKWTTGAGPRIGCVRDYPAELQKQALEQMCLSPRSGSHSITESCPQGVAAFGRSTNHYSPRPMIVAQSRNCSSPLGLSSPSPLSMSRDCSC
ncbi:IQ domain-containing protein IQM2-like [Aristolochia californica]|uniref:IQ domain-containing protein IQM2-like n=1 Tax=Aristolochia californica TaxID=171875 RepID=UPI0035DB996C